VLLSECFNCIEATLWRHCSHWNVNISFVAIFAGNYRLASNLRITSDTSLKKMALGTAYTGSNSTTPFPTILLCKLLACDDSGDRSRS